MPITVLTSRGYDGAATSRDVYAAGVRYRIVSSMLHVYGPDRSVLGVYARGSWTSVVVDEPAAPAGLPTVPRPDTTGTVDRPARATSAPPAQVVPVAPMNHSAAPTASSTPRTRSPATSPATRPAAAAAPERVTSVPAWMTSVAFRPKVMRGASGERRGRSGTPRREDPRARMLQLTFRPKTYRAARAEDPVGSRSDAASDDRDATGDTPT